jgi:2'-5' RNA ligase
MRGEQSPKSLTPPRTIRAEAAQSDWIFHYGTPDERTWEHGADRGLHVGTYEAARQALEATIGAPAEGEWDGTREYGRTPIVSNAKNIGYHSGLSSSDRGSPRHENARYSNGAPVPMDARPSIFPVRITGEMTNHPATAMDDAQANGRMKSQITRGQARRGYFYRNVGEDAGSVSAVVPSAAHLERIHPPREAAHDSSYGWDDDETYALNHPESVADPPSASEEYWNPPHLYHGTSAELRSGDMAEGGHPSNFDKPKGRLDHAYATPHISTAADYAETAAYRRGGHPRVYEVDRAHDMLPDPETGAAFGISSESYKQPDWRSKSGFRVLRELHPSEFKHHLTEDWPRLDEHTAARWQPSSGIFGPTTGLDPRLFDEGGELRGQVRYDLMTRLDQCIRVDSGLAGSDWQEWTHVYLTGGSASEWAGSRPNEKAQDLDVIVAVDLPEAQGCSAFEGMSGGEAASALNAAFWRNFNADGWRPDFGGAWNLTAFCNQRAQDGIAAIRPYAAWDLTEARWAVRPPHLPEHTVADFDPAVIAHARAVADEARAVLRMAEPLRTREARDLWEHIHAHRCVAFSDQGTGWDDPGNVDEKMLAYAPRHLLDQVRELALAPKTAAQNPPCCYCGEPIDDEDVRDGQSAHEECSDMRWCDACQAHHDDPQEAEDHNEAYTEWGNHLPFEGGIHRGITVRLPPDVHSVVHDESRPHAERAEALARHLHENPADDSDERGHAGGYGLHWTDHEPVAQAWGTGEGAMFGPSEEQRHGSTSTHVVMHAASPHEDHIEADPRVLSGRNLLGYDHARSEREIPLKEDAPVRITGISWKRGGESEWNRHDFGETVPKTASWDSSGSDNHGVYLRFGEWPHDERSYSPAGGYHEDGVSAYDLDRHGDPSIDHGLNRGHEHDEHCDEDCYLHEDNPGNDPIEEMQGRKARAEKARYHGGDERRDVGHLVRGEMSGVGYDGEPLLKNVKRVGDWIDHRHLFLDQAGPHRLARDPSDEDYEEPEEKPPYGHRNRTAALESPGYEIHFDPDYHGRHRVSAWPPGAAEWHPETGYAEPLGSMQWHPGTGEVTQLHVRQTRQGIGTALWRKATEEAGRNGLAAPVHSTSRTPAADAWAHSVGGEVPPLQTACKDPKWIASLGDDAQFRPKTAAREDQLAAMDPQARATAVAQENMRQLHPLTARPLEQKSGQSSPALTKWLAEAGHPGADEAYVAAHPAPGSMQSNTGRGPDGEPMVALHPDRWDYGTLAHEAAHLITDHQTGRKFGDPANPEGAHGDQWASNYAGLLDRLSRGAGRDFLAIRRTGMGREASLEKTAAPAHPWHGWAVDQPHKAVIWHAQSRVRDDHPELTRPLPPPDADGFSAEGHALLKKALTAGGYPPGRADRSFVLAHDAPDENGTSQVAMIGSRMGIALHPRSWDPGTVAHEAAHLLDIHQHGRDPVQAARVPDEEMHGPEFAGHYATALNAISPGAGDGFLRHHADSMALVGNFRARVHGLPREYPGSDPMQREAAAEPHPGPFNRYDDDGPFEPGHHPGPFLHGSVNRIEPGTLIHQDAMPAGHGRACHNYFTTDRQVAEDAADQRNGRGYGWIHRVEPTGSYEVDHGEPDSWRSEAPLRVLSAEPERLNGNVPHPPILREAATSSGVPQRPKRTPGSAMIYLDVPHGTVEPYEGQEGGHHVALAYLPRKISDEDFERVKDRAREAATRHAPMKATIGGGETFPPGTPSDRRRAAVVPVHAPGIHELQSEFGEFDRAHYETYTPHVTRAQLGGHQVNPPPHPEASFPVTHVHVRRGDEVHSFPLTGPSRREAARTVCPYCGTYEDSHPGFSQLYHASSPRNRNSVGSTGLRTEFDQGEGMTEPGIYMSPRPSPSADEDVWKVDTRGLRLHPDDPGNMEEFQDVGGSYFSHEDIPASRLTLHQRGAGNKWIGRPPAKETWQREASAEGYAPPQMPPRQHAAHNAPGFTDYRRDILEAAKNPEPGTVVWRSEQRPKGEGPRPASVGIHWTLNPDQVIHMPDTDTHHTVVYQGRVTDPASQAFPRSHPMWSGQHRSMDSEAEVRLQPGAHVHVEGTWTPGVPFGRDAHEDGSYDDRGPLVPMKPERMKPGHWNWNPVGADVPVRHAGKDIDYSDVGIHREAVSGYDGLTKRSGMIYLELPPGAVRPVPGGTDDHHVTLCYLGKDVSDEALAEACRRTKAAAARLAPMDGVLRGIDVFPPSKGSDGKVVAFVPAYIGSVGLLRRELEDLSASEHADWRPHVTLAYLEEGDSLPAPHPAVPLRFDRVHVKRGDDIRSYPLGGSRQVTASGDGPFYHGTARDFSPGDLVEAGHPVTNSRAQDRLLTHVGPGRAGTYNHASTSLGVAASYAARASNHSAGKFGMGDARPPRIYEVEFTGDREPDPDGGEHDHRSAHPLRVLGEVPEHEVHRLMTEG